MLGIFVLRILKKRKNEPTEQILSLIYKDKDKEIRRG
jgi:hypothetical protein